MNHWTKPLSSGIPLPPAPARLCGCCRHRRWQQHARQGWRKREGQGGGAYATPHILADQKAPSSSGGAPHYYLPTQIFRPSAIPELPVLELRARIFPPHCFSKVVFTLFKIGISSTLESSEQKTCLTTFQL